MTVSHMPHVHFIVSSEQGRCEGLNILLKEEEAKRLKAENDLAVLQTKIDVASLHTHNKHVSSK